MKYKLVTDVIQLIEVFEESESKHRESNYPTDLEGFKRWMYDTFQHNTNDNEEPYWEGKENGRTPESVINTLIVHMNRYAKSYSKSAIFGSDFSTQEEFIYLINLKAFGSMSKMELIKKNIQEKPVGMQIINRLIKQNWVVQKDSKTDKRTKIISITVTGLEALELQMDKIRQATRIVTGTLTHNEKMELIRLLNKLDHFHNKIFSQNIDSSALLEVVNEDYLPNPIH